MRLTLFQHFLSGAAMQSMMALLLLAPAPGLAQAVAPEEGLAVTKIDPPNWFSTLPEPMLLNRAILTLALAAPDSAQMHQVMARELQRHGETAAAIANYREAINIDPKVPGLHAELGDLLYYSTDESLKAGAQAEFEAAVAQNPNDERSILSLGMIAAEKSDLKTAYTDDSRAVQLDPHDTDACTELAKVLILMNERGKAEQMLQRAVQADPSNYVAHFRLAGLYRQQGKIDDAKKQIAEYQKYRKMKDNLQKIFEDMRVKAARRLADEESGPGQ